MIHIRIASGLTIWIVVLGMVSTTVADDKPVTVESSMMQPKVVLGRPMLTWWDVKVRGKGLLTGKLQFVIKSDDVALATVDTDELTLNGPEQRIRVLLPPVDPGFPLEQLKFDIFFRGKNFSGKVSEPILQIPFSSRTSSLKKVFVLLNGESKTAKWRSTLEKAVKNNEKIAKSRDQSLERLKFENLIPKSKIDRGDIPEHEYVKTLVASIDPADFPSEPLAYCGYDLVAFLGEEFRSLRKPQLEGLLAWIKAGGSLYVEPNGVLEAFHVDFLRNLVAEDDRTLTIQQDSTGRLPADNLPSNQPATVVTCGLGEAAIRIEDPDRDDEFNAEAWLPIIGPLWKMRLQPTEAPMLTYDSMGGPGGFVPAGGGAPVSVPNPDPWGLAALSSGYDRFRLPQDHLLDRLMPDNVQMVPTWVLAVILFAFVVAIGPGDYFLLGWLRLRSLTWLTFPIATIVVTALTVWLSYVYMSAAETRRAIVLCDVGQTGDIVRTNRFELLFVAYSHKVTTEVHKGLFSTISIGTQYGNNPFAPPGAFGGSPRIRRTRAQAAMQTGGMRQGGIDDEFEIQLPMTPYQGRIPTQFTVGQDLVKWTPQLNRLFSIPGTVSTPQFDGSEFELNQSDMDLVQQHQVPPTLAGRVRKQFGPKALVACFKGKNGWAYDKSAGRFSSRSTGRDDIPFVNYYGSMNAARGLISDVMPGESQFLQWIYLASVTAPNRMFTLTDHTTPKGGSMCDDLPLLDSSDPMTWLLVIVVPENDNFTVYRKLMRVR